ncbi:MAG: hypothetical protein ACD_23C00024G0001 [uncultured bacterium]|nr:MAG: hypothetical protein ACD_23C00024G0001 [uncultured bacterium]
MPGVVVVGEHDDRAALVARGQHHMLECVTGIAFGIDNDQVGLQLGYALAQKYIGGQAGDQVEAVFQQPDAQAARAIGLANGLRIFRISDVQIRRDNNDTKAWIHASKRCKNQASAP